VLTHLSLFSGIGGIDLAAEWVGFKSIGQCEMNDYARKVLHKNFGTIPRWRDVRDVTKESFRRECKTHQLTLLSGGFPCQPFSCAGKQRGEDDDRFLWPEMLRVVSELRPTWVLGENVGGFVSMALDNVLTDLENIDYETRAILLPACAVGAPHRRDRCFIVAHSNSNGRDRRINNCENRSLQDTEEWINKKDNKERCRGINRISKDGPILSHTNSPRLKGHGNVQERGREEHPMPGICSRWETEPAVGRVVDGFPGRVDRLRCLGNAVVPQQVFPILKYIAEIEKGDF